MRSSATTGGNGAEAAGPEPGGAGPLLELEGLGRTFDGPVAVRALLPTTLAVNAGEQVAVVGPSGSGKSTLLNLMGLLDRPTEGSYRVRGVATERLGETGRAALRAAGFGFVFQQYNLLVERSALENVEMGMLYQGMGRRERRDAACDALERVGLSHRASAYPPTMSGGECQRVAIARAVSGRPQVLLCDEPTGNLDQATSAAVVDLLMELNSSGLTIVVVSHDPHIAQRMGRQLHVVDGSVTE